MKIMSFLNISNPDNIETDSGLIFQKALRRSLEGMGHEFLLISYNSVCICKPSEESIGVALDKYSVRFMFNWQCVIETINVWQPDIVLSNQPELSSNLKAAFISNSIDSKLYTYIHYFPFLFENGHLKFDPSLDNSNFCKSIVLTFLSGILASDRIFVHSQYALNQLRLLLDYCRQTYPLDKIITLPPPFDKHISKTCSVVVNHTNILYNHRLYKQYGTDSLISFAKEINGSRNWKIIITDMLYNANAVRKRLDQSTSDYREVLKALPNVLIRTDGNKRNIYREIVHSSKIAMAPYRVNCPWSMSVIDCMSAGLPVVSPKMAWFEEFIPEELMFETMDQKITLIDRLFSEPNFYSEISEKVSEQIFNNSMLDESNTAKIFLS